MIGFLEESEGVRSMSRLTIAWTMALSTLVVVTGCAYVVYCYTHKITMQAEVLCALGGFLATLVVKCVAAIINRNGSSDEK